MPMFISGNTCPACRIIPSFFSHAMRTFCGITGIVSFKNKKVADDHANLDVLNGMLEKLEVRRFENCKQNNLSIKDHYLGGKEQVDSLLQAARTLKRNGVFYDFFKDDKSQKY